MTIWGVSSIKKTTLHFQTDQFLDVLSFIFGRLCSVYKVICTSKKQRFTAEFRFHQQQKQEQWTWMFIHHDFMVGGFNPTIWKILVNEGHYPSHERTRESFKIHINDITKQTIYCAPKEFSYNTIKFKIPCSKMSKTKKQWQPAPSAMRLCCNKARDFNQWLFNANKNTNIQMAMNNYILSLVVCWSPIS